jgi:fluoroquinolone transport system permease protein
MKRLRAAFGCDVRLQYRNGFYYAAAFVALFWIVGLRLFPVDHLSRLLDPFPAVELSRLMPVFILSNLFVSTFYFIAGLVLLEKGEGTLKAQAVTPLRNGEYLTSKIVTLTLLAIVENLLIVGAGFGLEFDPFPLIAGTVSAAAILVLIGFVAVSRYDSINEFLFPSMLYMLAFLPPFFDDLGLWNSKISYLHPLQAPLLLTRAAFQPISAGQWLYALPCAGLWIGLFFLWSRRIFGGFVISTEGTG